LWLLTIPLASTEAQESMQLRYRPSPGAVVHTLWWFDVTSSLADGRGDDLTIEASGLRSMTQRVVDAAGNRRIVEVTRDSLRLRRRPAGGLWTVIADSGQSQATARLEVDDRLRVQRFELLAPNETGSARTGTLRAFAAGFELSFPDEPQAPGATWTADVVIPFDEPIGIEEEPGIAAWLAQASDIVARSTVTLDSIVVRSTDTLAYLQVRGTFLPTTLASAGEVAAGRARLGGAFGGRLIWSTGWQAFVAGALRYQVRMSTFSGRPEAEVPRLVLDADISTRFQVRR
jgi:hypothetical protein